ncbi:MAG TPA: phosphodiester glycosidase family protein [Nocardioides sp.]|uniref:phosphodiester glycosidase family protein n=1 Tax=Nocardioides sp. TaxID=35761 RepID=UPI002BF2401F|nr:phosphodiester glycosidase family protein [Nocardioides sp.]HTW18340.1 phosphodiester glycosidase family protein [Nocardioides sp.]
MSNGSRRGWRTVTGTTIVGLAVGGVVAPAPPAQAESAPVVVEGMNLDRGGTAVVNQVEREEIAPGLVHVGWDRLGPDGWQHINVLKAEMSDSTVKMRYLTPETVSGDGGTVTDMTERAGAIAGVNLDRFDINNSTAATGWGIQDGTIIKSGNPDAAASVGMTKDGLGALVNLALVGSATFADDTAVTITGVNVSGAPADGVTLYNSQWGAFSRARTFNSVAAAGVEVIVGADGKVVSVSDTVGEGTLPAGQQALVTSDASPAAVRFRALSAGDPVDIAYGINEDNVDIAEAGGAWHPLVTDGVAAPFDPAQDYFTGVNPRTMIGFSEDRRTAYFVVVDGRTAVARGMGFPEMARLLVDLGADDAINADGGGSSQMNVRRVGASSTTIANSPSDGYERHDGDGMGLVLAQQGSGRLEGYAVEPASQEDDADRVFTGFRRTLVGRGYDETRSAVDETPGTWTSADRRIATVADGVATGRERGFVDIRATRGIAVGAARLQVLGEPTRLTVDHTVVNLERRGSSQVLAITGRDAQGFTAPVEPADLTVENPAPDAFQVEPTPDGRFLVTAVGDEGTGTITFRAGELTAEVAVAVPLEVRLIDDFSDVSGWTTAHDRAPTGALVPGEGHEGDPSIRLNYDFTESVGTRGRYAVAPGAVAGGSGGIDIPGRPQKLSVWIKGDGNGSLLRLQVMQANGVRNWLDGVDESTGEPTSLYATWTGWERKDFVVPSSFAFPLKLERIRILETVAAKQYTGSMEFSKIYAYLPPEGVEAPVVARAEDPVVVPTDATDDDPLRVAVMSDAQFVARDPDSGAVQGARDALEEIVAAEPDALVINGDFVDEASPADFDLARSILDEELADAEFPWYYVPGNHEIMGGPIANFVDEFGPANHTFDLENTRFVTLNSATGKLADSFSQIRELRTQLDDAATDPRVTGVVVFSHHPIDDPLPTKGSQLSDRKEAGLLQDWLTDFRADSGKSIAFVGSHVGVFHAETLDGVPHLINGNSGKGPASTPANGGFTGWTMLGIDPVDGRWQHAEDLGSDWLSAEINTRVDRLDVAAPPAALRVGDVFDTDPQVTQDDTSSFDLGYPSSSRWSGSDGVFVGAPADAPTDAIAAIDPTTHELTALRAGAGTLELAVNDGTASLDFSVTGGEISLDDDTPSFGQTLTSQLGSWVDGADVTYQWLRGSTPIVGANDAAYVVGLDDVGQDLSVRATVTGAGRAPVTVSARTATAVTPAVLPAPTVGLTGDPVAGGALRAEHGAWPSGTELTYRWLRDGASIAGARSSSYLVEGEDVGHRIQVVVTGHLAGHTEASATSAATALVTRPTTPPDPDPVPEVVVSATPSINGVGRVGVRLRAVANRWEDGTAHSYQWLRAGAPIAGATGATYLPTAGDRGQRLSVRVLGAKPGKVAVSRDSRPTAAIAAGRITTSKPRLRGVLERGEVLRVVTGRWDGARLTYAWFRNGKQVRITTKPRYRLSVADVGKRIRVTVRGTKPGYTPAKRSTARSAQVRR